MPQIKQVIISIIEALVRENTEEPCLNTELENLLIEAEENVIIVETRIKILDKNYDEIFGTKTAWSLLIYLFLISIPETVSQSLWISYSKI